MHQLTTKDGLPSLTVYDIFQDSRDYIWIGTDKGLCRYDGQKFRYYYNEEQKGTSFDGIVEDKNGEIWCKNFNGQLFCVKDDSMHRFDKLDTMLVNNILLSFTIDCENRLWFHTNKDLWYYDISVNTIQHFSLGGDNEIYGYKELEIAKYVREITTRIVKIISNHCELLLAYWAVKGFHISKERIYRANCPDCRIIYLPDISFPCLLIPYLGQNNQIFYIERPDPRAPLQERYLLYQRKSNGMIMPLPLLNDSLQKVRPIGITQDYNNRIWVYTYDGVFYQNSLSNQIYRILRGIQVSKVLQDREGNYWFSTLDNGLFFMPNLEAGYFDKYNFPIKDHRIKLMTVIDSTKLVLGTSSNLHPKLNIQTLTIECQFETTISAVLEALEYDKKSKKVYIQQNGIKLFQVDDGNRIDKSSKLPNIKDFHFFDNGYTLFASRVGAHLAPSSLEPLTDNRLWNHIKQKKDTTLVSYHHTLFFRAHDKYQRCNTIYATDFDNYWLGYGDTLMYFTDGRYYPILTDEGQNIRASKITETSDNLIWVSTTDLGLFGIKDKKALYHFTPSNGLISKNVITLKADDNGLWIGTDKGLQYLDEHHNTFRTYDQSDGLASNEINDIELLGGKVWLATNEGLISFDKDMPSVNNYAPPIYLTQIAINGEDTALFARYELPHHRNNFFISFQGIAYRSQGNFRYKYRMEGLSEEWIYVNTAQNELRFMSLNPGDYQLEIYAVNEDGVESRSPIVIDFCIHPPYWQTWWFWTLMGGGLFLAAAGITWWQFSVYRRRQAMLMQMQQLRTQALQSQMNPHFIFNAMNAIQRLMVKDTMENALSYMAKFAKLIRMIFEISGQSAVALEEEVTFLKLYLDLEKLRFKNKVMIDFQIDEALWADFYFIPPLLIQPIIENSFKHGLMHKEELGNLSVVFKKDNDYLYVCVEDNGVGRKKAAELSEWKQENRKKTGQIVTKERLSILKAHPNHIENFKITDLEDVKGEAIGTRTELWIPFLETK